jgi:hypothetical protein
MVLLFYDALAESVDTVKDSFANAASCSTAVSKNSIRRTKLSGQE